MARKAIGAGAAEHDRSASRSEAFAPEGQAQARADPQEPLISDLSSSASLLVPRARPGLPSPVPMLRPIPIGIDDFRSLREQGMAY
ncbi:MAG: hypothetical protein ACMG6S_30680, partial [Byssovorax sp.]